MGDAVMAFWNAPMDDPEHAEQACRSALEMSTALDTFNADLPIARRVAIGIGINTGACCVGNLGSEQRFDYSVIGDDVNIASRLEGLTKYYGVQILVGEATHAEVNGLVFVELDQVRVKGKQSALTIYALVGDEALSNAIDVAALQTHQSEMLSAYRRRDWQGALHQLGRVAETAGGLLDGYVAAMRYRITSYQTKPFPDDWDGVFDPETK